MKKKLTFLCLSLTLFSQISLSQGVEEIKKKANELFFKQKYTDAQKAYRAVLHDNQLASPSMLLKMAYTAEEMQDYPNALYYLYLYYYTEPSESTLSHIEDLANTYALKGYERSDWKYLELLYIRYYPILAVIFVGVTFVLIYTFFIKNWRRRIPTRYGIAMIAIVLGGYVVFNVVQISPKAVIKHDQTLLMQEASSGANMVEILPKGHCLEVLGKKDVWLEVSWNAQIVYVKESQVNLVEPRF